ncbi:hypothetical protein IWT5_02128 [Secundilactobacillus silagincola]|uniref:Uncharacterized protein n=1 Tax=Secundilactobacillus silagincola TaxID=1714681 RepID=A0A1Z5J4Z2_9LACO|nr:hypothetical protein [Secundilactobacillus silagincola]GAX08959.1 hypothetical protein IWT5_02128 [Secundilactobacillus silagincola]
MKLKHLIAMMILSTGITVGGVAVSQTSAVTASAKTTWTKGFPKVLHNTKWKSHAIRGIHNAKKGEKWYEAMSFWNSEMSGYQFLKNNAKYDKENYFHHGYYHHTSGSAYYYLKGDYHLDGFFTSTGNGNPLNVLTVEYYRVTVGKNKIKVTPQYSYGYPSDPKSPSDHYKTQKYSSDQMEMQKTGWLYKVK